MLPLSVKFQERCPASPKEKVDDDPRCCSTGPVIPWYVQFLNVLGCAGALLVYLWMALSCKAPMTVDMIMTLYLAEYNRFSNHRRRRELRSLASNLEEDGGALIEKAGRRRSPSESINCAEPQYMAAIVGYREDTELFTRALQSYNHARNCSFVLVGIDGDELEDHEMLKVFRTTFPKRSACLHLNTPLVEHALQLQAAMPNSPTKEAQIIAQCISIARKNLDDSGIVLDKIDYLCISQPHMHKKGIMFTSFIFSLVITTHLSLEWIWTSDSDTIVRPETVPDTVSICASDTKVGGACSTLVIHNRTSNLLTRLSAAVYLSDYNLARSFPSSFGSNECQSGPCALFRATALAPTLLEWYNQSVCGKWMRINEDRHLTTLVLRQGYNVLYAADSITATESPPTLRRWLLQQVRWGRAVHIESIYAPRVYALQHPVLFFNSIRGELGGLIIPFAIVLYALTGYAARPIMTRDFIQRLVLSCAYLALRNPYRPEKWTEWLWLLPGQVFYNIATQGIRIWSLVTMLDGTWGTCMRGTSEIKADAEGESSVDGAKKASSQGLSELARLKARVWSRINELGFFVVWIGFVSGALARVWGSAYYGFKDVYVNHFAYVCMVSTWCGMAWWMITVTN